MHDPRVYIARVTGTSVCRIGVSANLRARLQVLRKHCHRQIEIEQSIGLMSLAHAEAVREEIVRALGPASKHLRGDWYEAEPEAVSRVCLGVLLSA